MHRHQYIDRKTSAIMDEHLFHDELIQTVYSEVRERAPFLFDLITSARMSSLIAFTMYDFPVGPRLFGADNFVRRMGVTQSEILSPETLDTPRKFFERKIKYWECRPLPKEERAVAAPADSRMLAGTVDELASVRIKEKFFSYSELLGEHKVKWAAAFSEGEFAVFRLTPEKYHWSHFPVAGVTRDFYEVDGAYHSCNPSACIAMATPYSKNRRAVTVIDTDVPNGTQVGLVAMVEVAALMIGGIDQRYSAQRYDSPTTVRAGMFVKRGAPKSVFRPGSSVDILLFQKDRVQLSSDIAANLRRTDVESRYTTGFSTPIVETEVLVRSEIARRAFKD